MEKKIRIAIVGGTKEHADAIKRQAENHDFQVACECETYDNFTDLMMETIKGQDVDTVFIDSDVIENIPQTAYKRSMSGEWNAMVHLFINKRKPAVLVYDEKMNQEAFLAIEALFEAIGSVKIPPPDKAGDFSKEFDLVFRCCEEAVSEEQGIALFGYDAYEEGLKYKILPNRYLAERFLYEDIQEEMKIQIMENGKELGETLFLSKDPERVFYGEKVSMYVIGSDGLKEETGTWECPYEL